jgi:hypothetical protein
LAVRALVASLALNLESIFVGGVIDPTQIDLIQGNRGCLEFSRRTRYLGYELIDSSIRGREMSEIDLAVLVFAKGRYP